MTTQAKEIKRVSEKIAEGVLQFCEIRKSTGNTTFHAAELRKFVDDSCGPVAPASADRILRLLRQEGKLNYVVVSRKDSLYALV